MRKVLLSKLILFLSVSISSAALSDVVVVSPFKTKLVFFEKTNEKGHDLYAWRKLSFIGVRDEYDMNIKNRYFIEDGTSKLSPSGRYFVVNSISGGYLHSDGEKNKYIEKEFCSVVDMKTGCYISDWDGEACSYKWKENKDVLENPEGTDIFDFYSFRPKIKSMKGKFSILNEKTIKSYLRCDAPDKENINTYQEIMRINKLSGGLIMKHISIYLNDITEEKVILIKSFLFTYPENTSITRAYLIPGDKVKVIKVSPDKKWVNVGYISVKGTPRIAWIMADSLHK